MASSVADLTNVLSESDSLLLALVDAVAAVENQTAASLPPLSETVGVEALETLVGTTDGELTVSFSYQEYHVVVTGTHVEPYGVGSSETNSSPFFASS